VYPKTSLIMILMIAFLFVGIQLIAEDEKEEAAQCCFVNPNYQGVCSVSPTEGESCDEILVYSNPRRLGASELSGRR
jgi:hypothetical protein